ncbi:fungal-specific transcription factor domain-containing protein [Mycena sanguinolenta]|nr:fungal-specific transcription factor domain-containing protein [Mycena sanguinolenta]
MLPSSSSRARKVDRACDACRRRKTKCDGPKMRDNICSNCLNTHKTCTYLEASTPRGPPKAYVTGLEDRLEQLEKLLKQVRPDTDFTSELGPPIPRGSWKEDGARMAGSSRPRPKDGTPSTSLRLTTRLALNMHDDGNESDSSSDGFDSSDSETAEVPKGTAKHTSWPVESDGTPLNTRFHGKSSLVALVKITQQYKELHISEIERVGGDTEPERSTHSYIKRPELWRPHLWEQQWEGFDVADDQLFASVLDAFPPPALAAQLINFYFIHCNSQLPLLHRPTFKRQFGDQLHHRSIWFSCVCLGIFAVASRWSDDPLVLPRKCKRTSTGDLDWTCAGWHYHDMAMGIHRVRQSLLYPACLEEIQTFTLLAMFVRATINHAAGWIFVSMGLRKAQDVGAHRKKKYGKRPSANDELWKRAFWCLVAYDRMGSAILGRPCSLGEEDFDLDMCLEVDDEYWEADFRQPPGIPCRFTYFNLWLKLAQIITFTVRTIYSVHNPRALLGRIAKVRTNEVIAQLNVALQDWLGSVPDYLKWSPHIKDDELSNQSASLYISYYLAEMLLYRAFIPPIASPSAPVSPVPHISVPFPALAYCINAARSSARIIEVQLTRGWTNTPILIAVSQLSAAMLTLGVWDAKAKQEQESAEDVKPPLAHTIASLMDDTGVFIRALELVEPRWENVARLLRALKAALPKDDANVPLTQPSHSADIRVMERPPPDLSLSHPDFHTFNEPQSADSDHWSLPFHSSSVRHDPPLEGVQPPSEVYDKHDHVIPAYPTYPDDMDYASRVHFNPRQDHPY